KKHLRHHLSQLFLINGAYFWKLYARSLILPGFGQGFYNIKSFTGQQYKKYLHELILETIYGTMPQSIVP
ncbi:MAG: hypothetical protein UH687_03790, partial [Bacteroidaceae bacterium]|nr:hypothetical protein [Bacteroidaceae bacterium]